MTSVEGELADALARMRPDNKDLAALRNFAREVYASRGLSQMQLFYDLAGDADLTVVYLERYELDEVLGRPLSDADLERVQLTLTDADFEEDLISKVADDMLVRAGISA